MKRKMYRAKPKREPIDKKTIIILTIINIVFWSIIYFI